MHRTLRIPGVENAASALPDDCGLGWRLPNERRLPPFAAGELNRYDPATGSGNLTDQYLKDRAAMLSWKLGFGTRDTEPVGDTFVKPQSGTPFYFEDFTSNAITTKMRIGGGDSVNANAVMSRPLGDFKLIVFGSENNDVLTGQGKADRLYGGAGNDELSANDAVWKEVA